MVDTLITLAILSCALVVLILAVALLAWHDRKRYRDAENARPLHERIESIRESAAFNARELQQLYDRKRDEAPQSVAWIPAVVEYLKRLEALAQDANSTADQAEQLAREANQYVTAQKLKGLSVGEQASKLAKLIQLRDAG